MGRNRLDWDAASIGTTALGTALLLGTAYHHGVREPAVVGNVAVPAMAFLLDGGLALGVVAVGVTLARSEHGPESRRTIALFGAGIGLGFTLTVTATMAIRIAEGRSVSEPVFVLFTGGSAGFLIGALAGRYRARSHEHARSAARRRDALAFVNGMLRHDVRNDGAVIAGYADRLGDSDAASVIRDRASRVVDRTELARTVAETVNGDVDPGPAPLRPLVADATESATNAYPSATVVNAVPPECSARVNEAFTPVLDNVIGNAFEHHDGEPTVRIEAERDGDRVRLSVLDDGPGIEPAEREDLFDHDGRTAKGLNVVTTIVEELGGDVEIRDRDPSGTAVVVSLPAGPDRDGDAGDGSFGGDASDDGRFDGDR